MSEKTIQERMKEQQKNFKVVGNVLGDESDSPEKKPASESKKRKIVEYLKKSRKKDDAAFSDEFFTK